MSVEEMTQYSGMAEALAAQVNEAAVDFPALEVTLRPCELSRCRATCCHDGVTLSEEEAAGVRAVADAFEEELRGYGLNLPVDPVVKSGARLKTETRVAEAHELAEDYPAHFPPTKCVFLDAEHRCGLQRLAMAQGRHPWFYKPVTCWLHPLILKSGGRDGGRPLLTLYSPETDPQRTAESEGFAPCTHCGRQEVDGQPADQVLEDELRMLSEISGRDLLAEIRAPQLD